MMPFMTFHAHSALALSLIALVAGCFLLSKACAGECFCKTTGKIIGSLVILVSLLSSLCIGYLTVKQCCKRGGHGNQMNKWEHPPMDMSNMPGHSMPTAPTTPTK